MRFITLCLSSFLLSGVATADGPRANPDSATDVSSFDVVARKKEAPSGVQFFLGGEASGRENGGLLQGQAAEIGSDGKGAVEPSSGTNVVQSSIAHTPVQMPLESPKQQPPVSNFANDFGANVLPQEPKTVQPVVVTTLPQASHCTRGLVPYNGRCVLPRQLASQQKRDLQKQREPASVGVQSAAGTFGDAVKPKTTAGSNNIPGSMKRLY